MTVTGTTMPGRIVTARIGKKVCAQPFAASAGRAASTTSAPSTPSTHTLDESGSPDRVNALVWAL